MFRILGFIIGSAVSIAGIFFVLGTPEIHLSEIESDQARFDAALEKIREKQAVVEEIVPPPVVDEPVTQAETEIASVDLVDAESLVTNEVLPEDVELFAEPQDLFNSPLHWHEFWNPFRSELAAQGFVSQLEKVTGLDYRVVKVKAGVYQVGFEYADDDERRFKISQISAATGLDLPQT